MQKSLWASTAPSDQPANQQKFISVSARHSLTRTGSNTRALISTKCPSFAFTKAVTAGTILCDRVKGISPPRPSGSRRRVDRSDHPHLTSTLDLSGEANTEFQVSMPSRIAGLSHSNHTMNLSLLNLQEPEGAGSCYMTIQSHVGSDQHISNVLSIREEEQLSRLR